MTKPHPPRDSTTTHLRSRAPLASAQSTTHSLHSPQYMVVTAVTMIAAFKQPRARWSPPRPSSSLRRPLRAAGCVKAPRHYLRPRCMIPRRDLGSIPKRADDSWTSSSSWQLLLSLVCCIHSLCLTVLLAAVMILRIPPYAIIVALTRAQIDISDAACPAGAQARRSAAHSPFSSTSFWRGRCAARRNPLSD